MLNIYYILVIFLVIILLYFYFNYNSLKIPNLFKNKWQCIEGDCIFINDDSREFKNNYPEYNSKKECQKKCGL